MSVVEVGQYFVTRNVSEFVHAVACHEYTLPRDDPASKSKGWIKENTRIGPVLEVTTSFQQFKYGVEVRIPSVKEDNSQSWVRISYGTVKYVSNGLIPGGQDLSKRQSVFFLLVDPRKEDHKDPEYIDYSVPRLARYLQNSWKRHQDTVFWVDIDLGIKEGLKFYQTRSNAIILQGTLPAYFIVRTERLKTGEKLFEKQYLSPRPPSKISLRRDLNWTKKE